MTWLTWSRLGWAAAPARPAPRCGRSPPRRRSADQAARSPTSPLHSSTARSVFTIHSFIESRQSPETRELIICHLCYSHPGWVSWSPSGWPLSAAAPAVASSLAPASVRSGSRRYVSPGHRCIGHSAVSHECPVSVPVTSVNIAAVSGWTLMWAVTNHPVIWSRAQRGETTHRRPPCVAPPPPPQHGCMPG